MGIISSIKSAITGKPSQPSQQQSSVSNPTQSAVKPSSSTDMSAYMSRPTITTTKGTLGGADTITVTNAGGTRTYTSGKGSGGTTTFKTSEGTTLSGQQAESLAQAQPEKAKDYSADGSLKPSGYITSATGIGGTQSGTPASIGFGTALISSLKGVTQVGKIGQEGFGSYFSGITIPFNYLKQDYTSKAQEAGLVRPPMHETIINYGMPKKEWTPAEIKIQSDIKAGVPIEYVGMTKPSAYSKAGDIVAGKIQTDIDLGKISYTTESEKADVQKMYQTKVQEEIGKFDTKLFEGSKLNPTGAQTAGAIIKGVALVGTAVVSAPSIVGYETAVGAQVAISGLSTGLASKDFASALNPNLSTKERIFSGIGGIAGLSLGAYGVKSALGYETKSLIAQWSISDTAKELQSARFTGNLGKQVIDTEQGQAFKLAMSKGTQGGLGTQEIKYDLLTFRNTKSDIYSTSESGMPILIQKGGESPSFIVRGGQVNTRIASSFTPEIIKSTEKFGASGIQTLSQPLITSNKQISILSEDITSSIYDTRITFNSGKSIRSKSFGITKSTETEYKVAGGELNIRTAKGYKGKISAYGTIERLPQTNIGNVIESGFTKKVTQITKPISTDVIQSISQKVSTETLKPFTKPKIAISSAGSLSQEQEYKQLTKSSLYSAGITEQKATKVSVPTSLKLEQISFTQARSKTSAPPITTTIPTQGISASILPAQLVSSKIATTQINSQIQTGRFATPTITTTISPVIPSTGFGFGFKIPKGFLDLEIGGESKKGGKKRVGYMPSFSALAFGIRGKYKQSKLSKSGLEFRPITGKKLKIKTYEI